MTDDETLVSFYERMLLARRFEELTERLYKEGLVGGSVHLAIGQEAVAVGVCAALETGDTMTNTYRGRPQAISMGADPGRVLAELLGRAGGVCGGLGGPMHVTDVEHGVLGANAIVGAGVPIAAGAALTAKLDRTGRVAVTFFGEGSTNQGVLLETLNLAALWQLPLLFVCENNEYSEMTPFRDSVRNEDLVGRAAGFGVPGARIDGNDVAAVHEAALAAVALARSGGGPTFLEASTYRFSGHMVGDPNAYRSKEEIEERRALDPITLLAARLNASRGFDAEAIEARVEETLRAAEQYARESPQPDASFVHGTIYA